MLLRRQTHRSAATVRAGTPDMNIGRANADRAGARPHLRGGRAARSYYFPGCTLRNKGLPVSPFLERS
jgi:hypothetical protein